jgi:hypothetical protein
MYRAAYFLAGLLLLIPFAESPAAQVRAAPSWYRHPPVQRGYTIAKASADSALAALTDAIVALALERAARRRPAPAAGETSSEAFGAIGVQTTRTIVADKKAGGIEKTQATIEMKTAQGTVAIQWTREVPVSKGKKQAAKRVFNADMTKASARDLVAELKRAGVTVKTASAGARHYVLLKARLAGVVDGKSVRR